MKKKSTMMRDKRKGNLTDFKIAVDKLNKYCKLLFLHKKQLYFSNIYPIFKNNMGPIFRVSFSSSSSSSSYCNYYIHMPSFFFQLIVIY